MSLQSLIADKLNQTDAEIVAWLNTPSVEVLNHTLWNWDNLNSVFRPTNVKRVSQVIESTPGLSWVAMSLTGGGRDFSTDANQELIESLRQHLGDADTDALKALGRRTVSPWVHDGNSGEVTEQQVAAARQRIRVDQWWARLQNEVVNPAIAEGKSEDEILALIAEAGI